MSCDCGCTTQATMKLRVTRRRFVAYTSVKIIDAMLIDVIEQAHVCILCGETTWQPIEEIEL